MNQPFAHITQMVYDLLLVEITVPSLCNQDHFFDYSILSEDEKPLRKGRFCGSGVQLRMSQFAAGKYFLRLFLDGEVSENFRFEKLNN